MNIFTKNVRRSLAVAATIAVTAFSSVAFTAPAEARDNNRYERHDRNDRNDRWDNNRWDGRRDLHDRWDHRRDYRRDHHRHSYNHYRPRYYSYYDTAPAYYYPQPGFSFYYGY